MSESNKYDLKVTIDSIEEIVKGGWVAEHPTVNKQKSPNVTFTGIKIVLAGAHRKGKTFVYNKLVNPKVFDLPSNNKNTNFFAVKQVRIDHSSYILFDRSGKGQPVCNKHLQSENDIQNEEEGRNKVALENPITSELSHRAAAENFIDNMMFSLGDFFILVVGDITWHEQLEISKYCDHLANQEVSKLAIIHNLKQFSVKDIEEYFHNNIETNFKGQQNWSEEKDIFWFSCEETFRKKNVTISHYFIVDESPACADAATNIKYNNKVFARIIKSLRTFPRSRANHSDNLIDVLNEKFHDVGLKYFTENKDFSHPEILTFENTLDANDPNRSIFTLKKNQNNMIGFSPKNIPLSIMTVLYPSSAIALPAMCYETKGDGPKQIICLIEIPGLDLRYFSVDANKRSEWEFKMMKTKFQYQNEYQVSEKTMLSTPFSPSYGPIKIQIFFSDGFRPDYNNYKTYYERGILIIQILDQEVEESDALDLTLVDFKSENVEALNQAKQEIEQLKLEKNELLLQIQQLKETSGNINRDNHNFALNNNNNNNNNNIIDDDNSALNVSGESKKIDE